MSSSRQSDSYTVHENQEVSCSDFNFVTRILQPIEEALVNVDIGDILSIKINPISESVEIINALGKPCGVIASPDVQKLYSCMEKGYKFQAAVVNIMKKLCDVRIYSIS